MIPLTVGKEELQEKLSTLRVVKVDVQAPVNQPASLLESVQRVWLFLKTKFIS